MNAGGRLSPLVAGAAIAVMALGLAGIATVTGVLPKAPSHKSAEPALSSMPAPGANAACWRCGTVETIRAVEVQGDAGEVNGVTGATIGQRLGDGRGEAATAVIGVDPDHEAEGNVKRHHVYRVTLRMEDGSFRTVSLSARPPVAVGDKVRIEQGALIAAGS